MRGNRAPLFELPLPKINNKSVAIIIFMHKHPPHPTKPISLIPPQPSSLFLHNMDFCKSILSPQKKTPAYGKINIFSRPMRTIILKT